MSSGVNPILLKTVLCIVLAIDSAWLKMEQLMSWLESGHHAVSFFGNVLHLELIWATPINFAFLG